MIEKDISKGDRISQNQTVANDSRSMFEQKRLNRLVPVVQDL